MEKNNVNKFWYNPTSQTSKNIDDCFKFFYKYSQISLYILEIDYDRFKKKFIYITISIYRS